MRATRLLVVGVLVLTGGVVAPAAQADDDLSDGLDLSEVRDLSQYVSTISLPPYVSALTIPEPEDLDTTSQDGGDTVVTLRSDVLFGFDSAAIGPRARSRIATLVRKVPRRAMVQVGGHTDSLGSSAYNQRLSERRAKAVAAVVRTARPDLRLEVRGYGETQPVAPNTSGGKDDPEGRAENRRVELRYAD